jgi:hypothetical protein
MPSEIEGATRAASQPASTPLTLRGLTLKTASPFLAVRVEVTSMARAPSS